MPDIILLPEIATYFDVTVDQLMGYEPQLSKEQIQKLYGELGEQFAQLPFEEAFAKKRGVCPQVLLLLSFFTADWYLMAESLYAG